MIRAVVRKDLVALWASPLPWVLGALFHVLLGLLFVNELAARRQAVVQPLAPLAGFLLLVTVPVLTMRSFAEEARLGTLDLLLAVPVRPAALVAGKFMATWLTALAVLAPAGVAVVLLELYGEPDAGPVITGAVGLAAFAAAVTGVGVLASALTSSQPVAAVVAFLVTLVLWFAHVGSETLATGSVLAWLSISERLRSFAGGALDSADLTALAVLTAVALVLAAVAVDARRLR